MLFPSRLCVRGVQIMALYPVIIYPPTFFYSCHVLQVSDGVGYRAGKTGSTLTVESSTDASCFDSTKDAASPFTFSLSPTNIAECRDVRIFWDSASVQG